MRFMSVYLLLVSSIHLTGCGGEGASARAPSEPIDSFFSTLPEEASYPEDNSWSVEKELLGELLFWDPVLSGDSNVACASCHHPAQHWADGRKLSVGSDGIGLGPNRLGFEVTEFHSPSIVNVAFTGITQGLMGDDIFISGPYFWDLRADTLEEQALEPIKSDVEMRGYLYAEDEIMSIIIERLKTYPEYLAWFEAAFGSEDAINETNIARAIATFQRRIVTKRTRFDDYIEGDTQAFSGREVTGINKFINAGCARCHGGPMLSDFIIHEDQPVIQGRPAVRTPGLRNVELTSPYMHDGSRSTLRSAISLYEDRGDLEIELDDDDFGDIEAFLKTLTNPEVYSEVPLTVPSGLPVGGDIDL